MKKLFMVMAVVLVSAAMFVGCNKEKSQTKTLTDNLCEMYDNPIEDALKIAEEMGFLYCLEDPNKEDQYTCFKDSTVINDTTATETEWLSIMMNNNKVTTAAYFYKFAGNNIVEKVEFYSKEIGSSRVLGGVNCPFILGGIDGVDYNSYDSLLNNIPTIEEEMYAQWLGDTIGYKGITLICEYAQYFGTAAYVIVGNVGLK